MKLRRTKLCVNQRGAFTCNGISRARRGRLTLTSSIHSEMHNVAERNGFAQTGEFCGEHLKRQQHAQITTVFFFFNGRRKNEGKYVCMCA